MKTLFATFILAAVLARVAPAGALEVSTRPGDAILGAASAFPQYGSTRRPTGFRVSRWR